MAGGDRYVTPPLTTIRQPKVDLGQQAMQLLLALLNNESVQDLVVTPSLVTRASTARPRESGRRAVGQSGSVLA